MKLSTLVILTLLAVSCGDSPTAPTVRQLPDSGTKKTPQPVPTATVPAPGSPSVSRGIPLFGCVRAAVLADILEWELDGVAADATIAKGYSHSDQPGCTATEQQLRTENDHLSFWRKFPTPGAPLLVTFDAFSEVCGHEQVDLSVNGVNVLAVVIDYERVCGAPPSDPPCIGAACVPPVIPPTDPPPPECVPGEPGCVPRTIPPPSGPALWQTDLYCGGFGSQANGLPEDLTEANFSSYDARVLSHDETGNTAVRSGFHVREWCEGVHVVSDVRGNQAVFTIDTAPVTLSLVTYRKNGSTFLPQAGVDGITQTFTAPGDYQLTVKRVE